MTDKKDNHFLTPKFRVSYPVVTEGQLKASKNALAASGNDPDGAKYGVEMLFDTDTDLTMFKKAAKKAIKAKNLDWDDKKIKKAIKKLFNDGDTKDNEEYKGTIFIKAKNKSRPGVVLPNGDASTEPEVDLYAGCYAHAKVSVSAYPGYGGGVSVYVRNIQKLEDGEPFGANRVAAEDDFDAVEGSEEDYDDNDDLLDDLDEDDEDDD